MVNMTIKDREFYFDDQRLRMSLGGRIFVRLVSYAAYAFLVVGVVIFLSGDLRLLRAIGALIALFLADRAIHFRRSEKSILKLPAGRVNAAAYLSPSSRGVLEWAFDRALFGGGSVYLYCAQRLLNRRDVREGLIRMDIRPTDMTRQIEKIFADSGRNGLSKDQLLVQVERLTVRAIEEAWRTNDPQIDPKDLFSALALTEDESVNRLFKIFDISAGDLQSALLFGAGPVRSLSGFFSASHKKRHRIMNRAWTARPTPFLDQFSRDLTDFARMDKVGFLVGHAQEYDRLEDVLARAGRPNVMLIGDAGSGKSALVEHLAFEISKDRVPPPLFDRRLVQLEIGSLIAGAASQGELQARVQKVVAEIVGAGNLILYIPDIHNLLKTASGQGVSVADVFVPMMKAGAFSVIGATSPQEYKTLIEPRADFSGAFEQIKVQELSEMEATQFLVYESLILERQYRVIISFSAVKQAVSLAHKYFRQKLLPASAEDLLKEALADIMEKRRKILTGDDVVAVAEKRVNVPIHKAGKKEAEQLLNLEAVIHERLIDQEEAVSAVARALREYRSGLSRKGGPIAGFLFVGPTGVGKTELSKILAKIQFGSSEMMVRFDMSEYQDKSTVGRLLDNLTEAIRQKPYSLVLLDEFEKAHPDILNIFLQVLDDGRLSDESGRAVDFQNTIIIATSNANSEFIKERIENGASGSDLSEQIKKKLVNYFKPELLNRFSGIVVFKPLSAEDILAIASIQLRELAATLRENQGVDIQFNESAIKEIARLGFDPVFGARPLRGVISEKLRGPLAEIILKGEVARGGSINVDLKGKKFIFNHV